MHPIEAALAPLAAEGIELEQTVYEGSAASYIVYRCTGRAGGLYAEGREAETVTGYALSVVTPGRDPLLAERTRALLAAEGWAVGRRADDYDFNSDRFVTELEAQKEGAIYGDDLDPGAG